MVLLDPKELQIWAVSVLRRLGTNEAIATRVASHLVESNLAGHDSHGVGMLPTYVAAVRNKYLRPNANYIPLEDGVTYDGQMGFGQHVLDRIFTDLISQTSQMVNAIAVRKCHHIGRVGTYAELLARHGYASLIFANVTGRAPLQAPHDGKFAFFGTNPICIGFPRSSEAPIVLDMATSMIALGKTRVAAQAGLNVSEGMLLDPEGEPTNDPRVMFETPQGALMPAGAHKGHGLALFCEILGGVLSGGATAADFDGVNRGIRNDVFAIVFRPDLYGSLSDVALERLLSEVVKTKPIDSEHLVKLPGQPEQEARYLRSKTGIPMDEGNVEVLAAMSKEVGGVCFPS